MPAVNVDSMLSCSATAELADLLVKGITGAIRLAYAADPVVSDPEVGTLVDLFGLLIVTTTVRVLATMEVFFICCTNTMFLADQVLKNFVQLAEMESKFVLVIAKMTSSFPQIHM